MTLPIDELTEPLTVEDVTESIYAVIAAVGVDVTVWKPGAVVRTMIAAVAIILAAFSRLQALIAKSGYLVLAEGQWLTLVAQYVYNVERIEAQFAEGEVTLTNAGGGVYSLDAEDLIVGNPDTSQNYRNTEAFVLGASATLTIPIKAVESGAAATSTANTIVTMVTPLLNVTCTNALAVVGRDPENDADLRTRCAEKLGSLSPAGPWDAYAYAARNATHTDGSNVGVTRVRAVRDGAGGVTVYVAGASGEVTGTVDDPASDLGIIDAAIALNAEPLAVTAVVESATPVEVPISYELWVYNTTGLTDAQLDAAIAQALGSFFLTQPIGGNVIENEPGKIFRSAIQSVIGAAGSTVAGVPLSFRVDITTPTDDVELASNEVAVLSAVVGTIHQVQQPERF